MSRTFGDIESKAREFGGTPGIVVADPEITVFEYSEDLDYVLLGCDGIFDTLTNEEVNKVIWETVGHYKSQPRNTGSYQMCLNDCVNNVLKKALMQHSEDNVTVILVVFRDLFD